MRIKTDVLMWLPVVVFVAALVLHTLPGCSNPDRRVTSAIGLKATKDLFVAAATSAKRLCEQGALSEDDCATAEKAYAHGRQLLLDAKVVWDGMTAIDSFENYGDYDDLLMAVTRMTTVIENTIRRAH